MQLPQYARLYSSDFPQADQKLVDQMSYTINNGFDSLFQLSQNGIGLADNVACTVATVTVTVDATGTPTSAASYTLNPAVTITTLPLGTIVISASSTVSPPVYPTGGVFVTTSKNQNKLIITNVAGLPANVQFSLTLLTFQS